MDGFLDGRSLTGAIAVCFVRRLMNKCLNQYGNQSPAVEKESIICHAMRSMRPER